MVVDTGGDARDLFWSKCLIPVPASGLVVGAGADAAELF